MRIMSSSSSSSSSSSQSSRSRRTSAVAVAALALTSVLVFASLPTLAYADHPAVKNQAGFGSNNGHNQVHAANIHHLHNAHAKAASSAAASASKKGKGRLQSATSTKLPSAGATDAAGSANATDVAGSANDTEASSNILGASMHQDSDGAKIYSIKNAATKLVGEGLDTIYSSNATACSRHYTVTDTDTCDIIGHKTHTSTYQIMALNLDKTGPDCYFLEAGMKLCLGRFGSDCQLVHQVRSGESCTSILGQYDISREILLDNNPNLDCANIYNGLNLCVAPGRVAPPEPRGMYVARRSTEDL
ncbi:hypothetical protein A4X09_0g6236 [Tilletia walkeri]|uniref:LysM domain-containing protein n=1 Tax=Tilletia walkeri TaxID=117179 RepID=A0A8X7N5P5_9BASI|nr:hypothetical protein A4X09_0g6236 [Tilletia walkeri]